MLLVVFLVMLLVPIRRATSASIPRKKRDAQLTTCWPHSFRQHQPTHLQSLPTILHLSSYPRNHQLHRPVTSIPGPSRLPVPVREGLLAAVRSESTFRSTERRSRKRSSLAGAVGAEGTGSGRDRRDGGSSGSSRGFLRSVRRVDAVVRTTDRKREERSMQGSSVAGRRTASEGVSNRNKNGCLERLTAGG